MKLQIKKSFRPNQAHESAARLVLIGLVLFSLALAISPVQLVWAEAHTSQPVRNIILFIGDGMGLQHLAAARIAKGAPLNMDMMPVKSQAKTSSLNSAVTDSAAAGTALATGHRTNNGMIAMLPDGQDLVSSLLLAKEAGKKTGVVVTDYVYGATPGAFLANVNNRNNYAAILEQALFDTAPHVLMGGGQAVFNQIKGSDRLESTEYSLVVNRDQLLSRSPQEGGRLLGLFAAAEMTYEVDSNKNFEPSIVEMTQIALDILADGEEGFFLLVEGSRIDHASHSNDLRRMVHELLAFDEAIAVALAFASGRTDTLIVITADHETGGLLPGDKPSPQVISGGDAVALDITNAIIRDPEADVFSLFEEYAGVTDLQATVYQGTFSGFIKDLLQKRSFYYTSGGHTASPVPVFAQGPGADQFSEVEHISDIGRQLIELLSLVKVGGDRQ